MALPKIIFWKIWLERKAHVFIDKFSYIAQVVVKIKALLGDWLRSLWVETNQCSISPTEEAWLFTFSPKLPKTVDIPNPKLEFWEISM